MQAALFWGRVNFEVRLHRKQQLGTGMCFNSYITYSDTGVLIICSPFQCDRGQGFDCLPIFYSLCSFWFFFKLLLGFAPPSLSFPNPTIPAWQLHTKFIAITTQPPPSLLLFATRVASLSFPSSSGAIPMDCVTREVRGLCWCRGQPSPCQRWDSGSPQELLSPQDHQ